MKKCKYFLLGALAVLVVMAFAGCGKKAATDNGNNNDTDETKLQEYIHDAGNGLKEAVTGAQEAATDAVRDMKEAATNAASKVSENLNEMLEDAKNGAEDMLNEH